MNIAVIDVAAESGGALSLLNDFIEAVREEKEAKDEWYIVTSVVEIPEQKNIHNIKIPQIKRSWLHRLWWEYTDLRRLMDELKIDVILSLQNNALPMKHIKQVVYFHNVLLSSECNFSFWNQDVRKRVVYEKMLGPYIRHTWENAVAMVVQGNSVKEQVSKYFPSGRIYVCRPHVKIEATENRGEKVKGFIYPTTASTYKNLELVVAAVKALERMGKETEVFITISGNENAYAKKIARMAAQTEGIKLIGYHSRQFILEKYQKYGLIITSRHESFSIPILEAMKCQTVTVALDMPYVRDHMSAVQYNRLYVAEDNADSLASAMWEALADEKKGNYCENDIAKHGMHKVIDLVKEIGADAWDFTSKE